MLFFDPSQGIIDKIQIGLRVILCRPNFLPPKLLVVAIKALVAKSPALQEPDKGLVPDFTNVREISVHIAKAVIRQAVQEGLATKKDIPTEEGIEDWVRAQMWDSRYRQLQEIAN